MKRLILFLCLAMFGVANADFLGVKQASETISFFIKEPIDSAYGIPRLPDSVHILTYADNASAATFATRSTTYPFSDVSIDTLKRYGDTTYVFVDQISDLDGGGGNFELAILVRMFTDGYYLETHNTVQVVSDSLENFLDASKDSSSSAAVLSKNNLDSLQATLGVDVVEVAGNATAATNLDEAFDGDATPEGYISDLGATGVDKIWEADTSTMSAAQGVGTMLKDTSAYQGSAAGLDSGTVSRISHRVVWGTPQGSGSDSSTAAQRDIGVIAARAIGLVQLDSAFLAVLTEGIWLDDGAANTNTTVGIDGTITKPVSTLAAARILADSQSLQQYYLINNSSFTLDATYENWVFLGIGRGNSINFGSQDTDNSDFYNLMITGTQGGTGMVLLDLCYLNTPDSLEALVTRSSLSDTVSLRVSTATVFDQCYSNIAGNNTPGLDFDSTGVIEVSLRHYSGGLTIFNGTPNQTMSIETDGQLIIDTSCTSVNVTARGCMTITNRGTTTALTDAGVVNNNRLKNIISVVESQRMGHTHQTTGNIFYVDPTNGDTHANGNRGGIDDPYAGVQDCHDNAVTDSNHDLIILLAGKASSTDTLIEAVTLSKRYMFIRGPGRDFIWTRSGAGNTITITADGIELSGFQLETASTGAGNGIDLTDADFLKVHSVWINDTQGDGINILRGDNAQICCNHFDGTGVGGSGQGIDIVGTAGTSNGNVIEDNVFRDPAGDAIQISGGTTNNTTIKNNVIEGSTAWGIDIGASSVDAFVTDNRFGNNASGSINDNGTTTVLLNNEQWGTADSGAVYGAVVQFHEDSLADANVTQWVGTAPANVVNVGGQNLLEVNVQAFSENADAADSAELVFTRADHSNIGETPYTLKGVVEDSSGNGALNFQTDLASSDNDIYNRQQLEFISGNKDGHVTQISDYVGASGVIYVSPGLIGGAPNAGDSFKVTGVLAGLLANSANNMVDVAAQGNVAINFGDIVGQADSIDFADAFWAAVQNAAGTVNLPDSVVARIDSILASTGDSLHIHVGRSGSSTATVSLHMQHGSYSGAAGDDNNIKDDIAAIAIGSGSGANACTIYVKAGADFIQGVNVRLEASGGTDYYVPRTDSDGKAVFALDDGTYYGYATLTGYTQDIIPDTFTFTADYNDTLLMTAFAPSAPAGDLCGVYGWVKDESDNPIEGAEITATIDNYYWPIKYQNQAIVAHADTTTDSLGYWYLPIFPSEILLTAYGDSSSSYGMSCSYQGQSIFRHQKVTVPDSITWLMIPDDD